MKVRHTSTQISCSTARRYGGIVLTALFALSLVAGLFVLVRLQARAQAGPESVEAGLTVSKVANAALASPGDRLTYTIRMDSDLPSTEVWMTDTLPSGLTLDTGSFVIEGKSGSHGWSGNTITWTSPSFGDGNFAIITFSASISDQFEGELLNTVQVTSAGELITDSWSTSVVSGLLYSQIRSPNMDTHISEKGSRTVTGIAWRSGTEVPYVTDDTVLRLDPVAGNEWSYWARWNEVESAASYLLQESTDPNFGSLTANESVGSPQYLVAKAPGEEGTYYYRVQAVSAEPGVVPGRWSNVVSVTLPLSAQAAGASPLGASAVSQEEAVVNVRTGPADSIESSTWYTAQVTPTAWGGWEWSYDWSLPEVESTQYLIQSRAGETGPEDTITVTLDNLAFYTYLPLIARRHPPIPYEPTLYDIDNEDHDRAYQITWSYEHTSPVVPDPVTYTLQEAADSAFTDPTNYYPGGDEHYDMTDPDEEKTAERYYYRVRGHNAYGPGEWSNVVSTIIGRPPYAPELWVFDPNQDGDITVNWTYDYDYPEVDSYTLWEAEDDSFTDPKVFEVTGTSKERGDRPDGTCYKVRGNNTFGAGPWSNVVCIEVKTGLMDDFDDPDSGWELRRTSAPDFDVCDIDYDDGRLETEIDDMGDFALFSPMVDAPEMPYKITLKSRVKEWVDAPAYGIVFRGNKGDPCPVKRSNADDDDGCFYHYFRINISIDPGSRSGSGGHMRYEVKRIERHEGTKGKAKGDDLGNGYSNIDYATDWNGWNTWEVEVHDDRFHVYVNDEFLGTFYGSQYGSDRQFGILTSMNEYGPTVFEHEYFYVERID